MLKTHHYNCSVIYCTNPSYPTETLSFSGTNNVHNNYTVHPFMNIYCVSYSYEYSMLATVRRIRRNKSQIGKTMMKMAHVAHSSGEITLQGYL